MDTEKKKLIGSFIPGFLFVLLLFIIEGIESGTDLSFVKYGIKPRSIEGVKGILFAPLIHDDFQHLTSNALPVLVLSAFIFYRYDKIAFELMVWLYFITSLWTWSFAMGEAYHIGASGLVYSMVTFIFFSGVIRRERKAMALALIVTFLYGSMVWGIFPLQPGVSWESHLMGSITGLVFAYYFRKANQVKEEKPEEEIEEPSKTDGFYEGFYENEDWRIDRLHVHDESRQTKEENTRKKPALSIKYIFVPKQDKDSKEKKHTF